ncbi:MAG: hypothetical protein SF053_22370 [Bacteroidia bacterium]|nr:hypothetical protein [Bacteroidia bacterium]
MHTNKHTRHTSACSPKGWLMCGGLIGTLLTAWAVQWLWNSLVPSLFAGPWISYLQALAGLWLVRLLTGWRRRGHYYACKNKWKDGSQWRAHFEEKMRQKTGHPQPETPPQTHPPKPDPEQQQFGEGFKKGPWDVNVYEVPDEKDSDDPAPDTKA